VLPTRGSAGRVATTSNPTGTMAADGTIPEVAPAAGLSSARAEAVQDVHRRFDFFEGRAATEAVAVLPVSASQRLAHGLRPAAVAVPVAEATGPAQAPAEAPAAGGPPVRARGRGPREPQRQAEGLVLLPAASQRRLTWAPSSSPTRTNLRGSFLELRSSPPPASGGPPAAEPASTARGARRPEVGAPAVETPWSSLTWSLPRLEAGAGVDTAGRGHAESADPGETRKLSWGAVFNFEAASTAAPSPAASPRGSSPRATPRGGGTPRGAGEDPGGVLLEAMRLREAEAAQKRQRRPVPRGRATSGRGSGC